MATQKELADIQKRNELINTITKNQHVLNDKFVARRIGEEDFVNIIRDQQNRLYGRNADEENLINQNLQRYYTETDLEVRMRLLNSLPAPLALQLRNEEMKQNIQRKKQEAVTPIFDVDNVLVNDKYDFSRLTRMAENNKQSDNEYQHALNIMKNRYDNFANLVNDYEQAHEDEDEILTDSKGQKYFDPYKSKVIDSSPVTGVANSAFNKYLTFDNMKKYILEPLKALADYEDAFHDPTLGEPSPLQKMIFDDPDGEVPEYAQGDWLYQYPRFTNLLSSDEKREYMNYIRYLKDKGYDIEKPYSRLRGDIPSTFSNTPGSSRSTSRSTSGSSSKSTSGTQTPKTTIRFNDEGGFSIENPTTPKTRSRVQTPMTTPRQAYDVTRYQKTPQTEFNEDPQDLVEEDPYADVYIEDITHNDKEIIDFYDIDLDDAFETIGLSKDFVKNDIENNGGKIVDFVTRWMIMISRENMNFDRFKTPARIKQINDAFTLDLLNTLNAPNYMETWSEFLEREKKRKISKGSTNIDSEKEIKK